jgi:starch synthase (maltosyl-transferring)
MRAAEPNASAWPASLGRAVTLGFDMLLLPQGDVPPTLIEAAQGLGIGLLSDIMLDKVPADWLHGTPGPFIRTPTPITDPRHDPALAAEARVAIATPEDAMALAAFWAPRINAMANAGLAGVRLLGMHALPGWSIPTVLAGLRASTSGALLFAWTPGLSWAVLHSIPPGTVDLVAASIPWWDGQADWLWRELEILRPIAPVVADGGSDPNRQAFASMLAEAWMATADAPDAEALNKARHFISGLPWSTPVGPAGGPLYGMLRTDAPDPRRAHRAALALTALAPGSLPADALLSCVQGDFNAFTSPAGDTLLPSATVALDAGGLRLFSAKAHDPAPPASLGRKRAEAAAAISRVAIEAPSPCVENGRFPARQVVGSEVVVEADLIADGHDKLGAALRYRAPGDDEWTELRMHLVSNDRWTARFPLTRLGIHEYEIEAWKDAYATFVDELEKKHAAGVPIALELQEGAILVRDAAAHAKKSVAALLAPVLKALEAEDPGARREALLAPETRAAMARADDRPLSASAGPFPLQAERTAAGFASWYEVFPRSLSDDPARHGTFRDVVRHLPRVQGMGFDVLYFPPFHPIGRVNRKGRNNTLTPADDDPGSPYAIGSADGGHEALHPELGTIEDFQHLRQKAANHGIELAMDFAIQCAPDHPWLQQHKDWFDWRPDGSIKYAENPPKKYQDIVNVDFYAPGAVPDLWLALANAVLYWASQGIRLFRVDNPHTKPLPFWEWLITEVQVRYPDAVFLAEAFTRPKVMYRLAKSGFGQSYTYFTWRNTKQEFQAYLTELTDPRPGSPREYFRPHFFVNTPDINPVPLQDAPRQAFLVRVALATTLSGLWGLYNGFELCEATPIPGREEYLDSEKYQLRAWDWNRPGNIVAEISALNAIRKRNPALQTHLGVTFLNADNDQVLLFEKATPDRSNVVLVAINMDLRNPQSSRIEVPFWRWSVGAPENEPAALLATNLLTDQGERWTHHSRYVSLTAEHPYALWRLRPEAKA